MLRLGEEDSLDEVVAERSFSGEVGLLLRLLSVVLLLLRPAALPAPLIWIGVFFIRCQIKFV